MSQQWERRIGEPSRWFARFDLFRSLGPGRSIEEVYRRSQEMEGLKGARPGAAWYDMARDWQWLERAAAWDEHVRGELRAREQERRFDAREKRLSIIDRALRTAETVLSRAGLDHLSEGEAREWLPIMRLMLRDMLRAEQSELGLPVVEESGGAAVAPFTADDLLAASRAASEFEAMLRGNGGSGLDAPELQRVAESGAEHDGSPVAVRPRVNDALLVVVGEDPALRVDLAALRKVKRATGLAFHRLSEATSDAFDGYMRRERSKGRGVTLVHMAVHASAVGVQFADRVVDGDWLSERLLGVEVLMLAGCDGDSVGDWLGVVPHVVTLDEAIGHADAASLTEHFWLQVARGVKPELALELALDRCAPAVSEYVVRHW